MESANFAGFNGGLLDTVAAQWFTDDCGESLTGERHPGQPRYRLTVAHQAEQDRRHR